MQFSVTVRNARADQVEATIGTGPTLEIRSGAKPADCAAADAGSVIASLTLPSDWMAAASAGAKAKAGAWGPTNAAGTGLARHWRIKQGATCHAQGLCSEAWQASKAYLLGQQVSNGGNVYVCTTAGTSAGSGGPTGTGTGIADGTAVWDYVGAAELGLTNTNVNSGQPVEVTTFTITEGNG